MAKQIIAPARHAAPSAAGTTAISMTGEAARSARSRIRLVSSQSYADFFTGSVDDFIAAGFFTLDQCPGQPGNGKTTSVFYNGMKRAKGAPRPPRREGYIAIRLTGRNRASVQICVSKEEEARREERDRHQDRAKNEAERAQKILRDMPTTHAEYREKTARTIGALLHVIPSIVGSNEWDGFSYDDDIRAELAELAAEMLALVKGGGTRFNAKRQASIATGHRATIARSDPGFVAMLGDLTTDAASASMNATEEVLR